jgi:polyketide cyclase/dehydrase/lipid transport protein
VRRVYASGVVRAPVTAVWDHIRDFNGLPKWFPGVVDSEIENGVPSNQLRCVRRFHSTSGALLREEMIALSDHDHSCSYRILESPMPLSDYVATFRLKPITDQDHTFLEWIAEFNCAPERERGLADFLRITCFEGAIALLSKHFDQSSETDHRTIA